jgi:hypothetical protein
MNNGIVTMRVRADREILPDTDLVLDITLWIQIALLAYVIAIWDMPRQNFPPLFLTTSWQALSRPPNANPLAHRGASA